MKKLFSNSEYLISEHGYEELVADRLLVREVAAGLNEATESRAIQIIPKGHVFWCYRRTKPIDRFMSFGEFQKAIMAPQFS